MATRIDCTRCHGISLIVNIRSHQPGETLTFTVQRSGQERSFDVQLDSEVG